MRASHSSLVLEIVGASAGVLPTSSDVVSLVGRATVRLPVMNAVLRRDVNFMIAEVWFLVVRLCGDLR